MTDSSVASTVHWRASSSDDQPLLVFVHESDAASESVLERLDSVPTGVAVAVLPAPSDATDLEKWLSEVTPAGRLLFLAAHGQAVGFVGTVLMDDPSRFVGAAILNGAFEADEELVPAALTGLPIFHAQGERDAVVPIPQQNRTWDYLVSESGAPVTIHLDCGAHELTEKSVAEFGKWLEHRLSRLASHPATSIGAAGPATWPVIGSLPERIGGRPRVTWSVPQQQISDQSMIEFQDRLLERFAAIAGVTMQDSEFSVPGSRALLLDEPSGRAGSLLDEETGEFAHLHPWYDGSLHVALPADQMGDAIAKGWAQPHMWAGTRFSDGFALIYGPRNDDEIEIINAIVEASHDFATGQDPA